MGFLDSGGLGIGGKMLGGMFGDSDDGSDAIAAAMEQARALENKRFNQYRSDVSPYMSTGRDALSGYSAQLGIGDGPLFDVTQLPGYQSALEQGLSAVNQGAAGANMLMSGDRLKALQGEGQRVFGDYYSDYMNRLQGLQQQGLGAAQSLGSTGVQSALGVGNMMMGTGRNLAEIERQNQANKMGTLNSLLGAGATIGGAIAGGPVGAQMGSALSSKLFDRPLSTEEALANAPRAWEG